MPWKERSGRNVRSRLPAVLQGGRGGEQKLKLKIYFIEQCEIYFFEIWKISNRFQWGGQTGEVLVQIRETAICWSGPSWYVADKQRKEKLWLRNYSSQEMWHFTKLITLYTCLKHSYWSSLLAKLLSFEHYVKKHRKQITLFSGFWLRVVFNFCNFCLSNACKSPRSANFSKPDKLKWAHHYVKSKTLPFQIVCILIAFYTSKYSNPENCKECVWLWNGFYDAT